MIDRGNLKDLYPLSPMQEGMLFHALMEPGSPAYLEQMGFQINGALDAERFQQALDALVQRHEILRTSFVHEKTRRPLQAVLKVRPVLMSVEDLRSAPVELRDRRIADHLEQDRNTPFDLGRHPLLRLALFRVEDQVWKLIWTHHHILMDGWCVGILQSEFLEIYRAIEKGNDSGRCHLAVYPIDHAVKH